MVVGGGNIIRGSQTVSVERAQADYMGMLGTVITRSRFRMLLSALDSRPGAVSYRDETGGGDSYPQKGDQTP